MSDTAQVRFTSKGEDLITEDVLNGKKNKKEKNKKKNIAGRRPHHCRCAQRQTIYKKKVLHIVT